MNRILLIISLVLISFQAYTAPKLQNAYLSDYGLTNSQNIEKTLKEAIADLDGKRLILPDEQVNIGNLTIKGKKNFAIIGSKKYPICCKDFLIYDCSDFELKDLYVKGTKEQFATFYIKGDCSNFSIHDCLFDSERGIDGHNRFYGIHVIADTQKSNASYENSPRHFRIYNNVVKNTRYDGILAHAHCSDFVIEKNTIIGAECIGIEVEGRYGGLNNTTVHPCKNATIRNNVLRDCKEGWNILVMWTDNAKIYGNKCYNGFGSFLSIGCKNLEVKNNIFEGRVYGFELSNEFYKIENGINDHVLIKGNTIVGKARAVDRGVLDIRHSKNVTVKKNKITSIHKVNTAMVSVASSKHVTIESNVFKNSGEVLTNTVLFDNVPDYETKADVPILDIENVSVSNNTFIGQPEKIESKEIGLTKAKCIIKKNRYK